MADAVIIIAVILLMVLAAKQSLKHFRGEGSCCGGGNSKASKVKMKEKILSGPILGRKTIKIDGMHCEHCVQNAMEAINQIQGVSAKVYLDTKEAVISYEKEVSDDVLRQAVENAGYKVRVIL